MQVGRLRHRITIEQNAQFQNTIGEWIDNWVPWAIVWAAIEPVTGRDFYITRQIDSQVDGKVRIRYREGLLPTMRINYQDRILHIVSLLVVRELKTEIHIFYKEALD